MRTQVHNISMNDLAAIKTVPITDLRRNFGELTENLAVLDSIVLTRGGRPFAILKAAPEEKRKFLKEAAGSWKGTGLDSDEFWKGVLKKKSRKASVRL